ncbi:helix-turn-helix domain-containing protein [Salmonella enterica subsp. enterica serovar Typhimurium var. 5-]|uniref:Transposase n=1 Tax=Escherichia coli TaxID=562 RepID=A0A411JIM7_ECOLX|nr:helix-turn-helix domain-containing protein [Salmonella enterica subsp. enterica serovar Typhimurium var. 5-]QBC36084.1 Transposase [Escherichia coli]
MLRATKIRIYPTPEQAAFLNAQFGAVRFAYNKALHIKKHAYQRHGVNLSPRNDLKPLLSVAKKSRKYAWLAYFHERRSLNNFHRDRVITFEQIAE